jgi:hypothetical protein
MPSYCGQQRIGSWHSARTSEPAWNRHVVDEGVNVMREFRPSSVEKDVCNDGPVVFLALPNC